METLTKDMKIFSYRVCPACGREGDDGGFSVELYGNGNLRYCVYKFSDEIQLMQMFKLSRETVYAIYHLIETRQSELETMPEYLNNGSYDGEINEFEFFRCGRITAMNIQEVFVKGMILKNYSYYQEFKENMKRENTIMKLFKEICKVLKKTGVHLSLEACEITQDCKLKVTW